MAFTTNVVAAAAVVGKTQEEVVAVAKVNQGRGESLTPDQRAAFNGLSIADKDEIGTILESTSAIPADSFSEVLGRQVREASKDKGQIVGKRNAAYRGFTPKEEQVASLRIITTQDFISQANNFLPKRNRVDVSKLAAGGVVIYGTDQFILQSATEPDDEKVQIVETFGEPVAFFYGRRPRMYTYSGTLLNGGDFFAQNLDRPTILPNEYSTMWRDNFKLGYDLFLRGTRAVRFRARAYLTYDRVIREGYILRSSISQDIRPNMVSFMFSMFVTREISIDGVLALESNTLDGEAAPGRVDDALVFKQLQSQEILD